MSAAHRVGRRFRLRLLQDSRRGGLPLLPPQVSNRRLLGRFLEGEPGNGTTLRVCAGWRLDLLFRRRDMEKLTAKQTASDLTESDAIKQAQAGDAAPVDTSSASGAKWQGLSESVGFATNTGTSRILHSEEFSR